MVSNYVRRKFKLIYFRKPKFIFPVQRPSEDTASEFPYIFFNQLRLIFPDIFIDFHRLFKMSFCF